MKTPSDDLFKLIKSLDTQEKVHFKMFSQRKTGDNNYLLVFDLVNEMDEYDEEKLRKALKKHPLLLKNLKRVKSYTLDAILKSLSAYHAYTSVQSEMRNLLHQVEILSGKKLFKLAHKTLEKVVKIGLEFEQFEYLLLASRLEADLAYKSEEIVRVQAYIRKNISEEHEYVEKIAGDIGLRDLRFQAYLLNLNFGFSSRAQKKISQLVSGSPLLKASTNKLSISAKNSFYHLHYVAALSKDIPEKKDLARQLEWIKYLEGVPGKLKQFADVYLNSISALLVLNTYFNDKERAEAFFTKAFSFYNTLPAKTRTELVSSALGKVINNYMHCQLVWLEPAAAIQSWKKVSQTIPHMHRLLEMDLVDTIHLNLVQAHFMIGEYKAALGYANKVINHQVTQFRLDIQIMTRFYLLMTHYELGNLDVMDYLCTTIERWLAKMNLLGLYEKKILSFFRKTIYSFKDNTGRLKALKEFKKALELLVPDAKGVVMEYFVPWLDGKIAGRSFVETLKEKRVHGNG